MCGIVGWVAHERDLTREGHVIDAMTETMACRGPDQRGTWVRPRVALGHRRLAVIDLVGGVQPMASGEELPVALVYSGEVYNHGALRDELRRRGHRFTTESDTEVVLRGYLEWGESVAERLDGMFAFAIWDSWQHRLVMIRDRMGVKPLYYYPTADGVLFGSEPKAILANPLAERVVGLDGLREVFGAVKNPGNAVWEGMREVVPGTVVTVTSQGVREHVYWSLTTRPHTDDLPTTITRVHDLLDDAVRTQISADVPLCMLLSGGLDSSALTALAVRHLAGRGESLRTFSVDFAGPDDFVADQLRSSPDAPFVHEMAGHCATDHRDIVLGSDELADTDLFAKAVGARDLPGGMGDLDTSLYLLFKAVRQHATVALSGESADELFGGYLWFHLPQVQQADAFPWLAAIRRFFGDGRAILAPEAARALAVDEYVDDHYRDAVAAVERLEGESDEEHRMRRVSHLHLTRFVRSMLDRKDRMSMAVGLEVRVPFCDHRLVEYVYNTPWSFKTFDGREKSLLRAATAHLLPPAVAQRPKAPYPSTQDPAYARALRSAAAGVLADPAHPVFEVVSRDWLAAAVRSTEPARAQADRNGLERTLELAFWIDANAPRLKLS
ncbi:asparagine synthase (glutamine-hydrolyzing) [Actinosynnema sp. CA-299493]